MELWTRLGALNPTTNLKTSPDLTNITSHPAPLLNTTLIHSTDFITAHFEPSVNSNGLKPFFIYKTRSERL